MDESIRYSKISWLIIIFVVIGNFMSGKLGLPASMSAAWGIIALIALIIGIVFAVKGIKVGKKNGNNSAVTQGRVGLVLNSIFLAVTLLGILAALLINVKN